MLAIAGFGSAEHGTTVTPTVASAGTAENVVPAEARIRVDVRVQEAGEKERIEAAMAALATVDPDATIEVTGAINRPPMPESASASAVRRWRCGSTSSIVGVAVGGGSDGNFTAAVGVPTLDGLGAVGGGAHSDREYVEVAMIPSRIRLLAGLLRQLCVADPAP